MRTINLPGEMTCKPQGTPTLSRFSLEMVSGKGRSTAITSISVVAIFSDILECSGKIRKKDDMHDLDMLKNSWVLKSAAATVIREGLWTAVYDRLLHNEERTARGSGGLRRRRQEIDKRNPNDSSVAQKASPKEAKDIAEAITRNSFVLDNISLNPTRTSKDGYAVDVIFRATLKVIMGSPTHTEIFRTTREQYTYVIAQIDESIISLGATDPTAAERLSVVRDDVEMRALAAELHSRGHEDLSQELLAHVLAAGDPMLTQQRVEADLLVAAAVDPLAVGFLLSSVNLPLSVSLPLFSTFRSAMNDGWKAGSRLPDSLVQEFVASLESMDDKDVSILREILKSSKEDVRVAELEDPSKIVEKAARRIVTMLRSRISRSTLVKVILPQMKRISQRLYSRVHSWIPDALLGKKSEAVMQRELENKLKNLPQEDLVALQIFLRRLELGRTASWDGIETLSEYSEDQTQELFSKISEAGMLPPLRFAGGGKLIFHDKYETLCLEITDSQISASRTYRDMEEDREFDNLQELLSWTHGLL